MTTFQVIDEKNECFGVYGNEQFLYDRIPNGFDRTWVWSRHLRDHRVDYAFLYCGGRDIKDVCPSDLRGRFEYRQQKINAFVNSFLNAKIKIEDVCVFDLIPEKHLQHFLDTKNLICDHVFNTTEKPKNYSFLRETYETLQEISTQAININWTLLEKLARTDAKASSLLSRFAGKSNNVVFDLFGSKTGRLTTTSKSFPVLNVKTENKQVLQPTNDFFAAFDYNGAEIRVLKALSGSPQPNGDIHTWNIENVFSGAVDREKAKTKFFAWLYNSNSNKIQSEHYDRSKVLRKFYRNGVVETPFGREMETDNFHALNYLLQSTSSDNCIKQANKIHRFLRNKKSNVAWMVHDSVILDMSFEDRQLLPQIEEIFEDTALGRFSSSLSIGKNYGNMKEVK